MLYYPNFLGGKSSKMKRYFRKNKSVPIGHMDRYPIPNCVFRYPVDVSFGSTKPSESHRLRINGPDGIRKSANKVLTKNTIKDHCPVIMQYDHASKYINSSSIDLALLEEQIGFPLVAKLKYGMGGNGMYYINNEQELIDFANNIPESNIKSYFFEKFFDFTTEYRIHVAPLLKGIRIPYVYEYALKNSEGEWIIARNSPPIRENGEILGIQKKVSAGFTGNRNRGQGVTFSSNFNRPTEWPAMVEASIKACELMGLDFCCTDIMYNRHTREFVISETNTNPGMDNIIDNPCRNVTAQHYQQMFPHLITRKYLKLCAVSL